MAKRAKKKAATKSNPGTGRLAVRKEPVQERPSDETRVPRGAIVISSKALRGMVINRSAVPLLKRGR